MEPIKKKKAVPARPHGNLNAFGTMLKPVQSMLQHPKTTIVEVATNDEEEKQPASAQAADISGKVMKTKDDCQLIVDDTSLCARGMPYPFEKKTALESEACSENLQYTYSQYRKRGVVFAAFFKKTATLKSALLSLPKSRSNNEKIAIIYSHPRVNGHRTHEAFPCKRLDKSISPLVSHPGVFLYVYDEQNSTSVAYTFVCADHCFIADTYTKRSVTLVFRKQLQEQIMKCDINNGLLLFRLSAGEANLRMEFFRSDRNICAPDHIHLKYLDVAMNVECILQMPVLSDEYSQWLHIELEVGFIEKIIHDSVYGNGRAASGTAKCKGKDDNDDLLSAADADQVVVFRVYFRHVDQRGILVIQKCSLQPGIAETEITFSDLLPKRKDGIMIDMDPGKRAFFVMDSGNIGVGASPMLDDEAMFQEDDYVPSVPPPTTKTNRLAGYTQIAFCATNRRALIKAMCNGGPPVQNKGDMSILPSTRRPILMIPHRYDKSIDTQSSICGNGMLALVQTVGYEEAPKAFEVVKAVAELQLDESSYSSIPEPDEMADLATCVISFDCTDKSFV